MRVRWVATGFAVAAACALAAWPGQARAARAQKSVGFGPVFYSGSSTSALTPPYSAEFTFSSNLRSSKAVWFANRFDFGALFGDDFGGKGAFYGATGHYSFGPRFNFGKGGILPYLELGATIGLFAIQLTSPPSGDSKNQTALKYGYFAGIGFDSIRGDGGGWGISLGYFRFLPTPSLFEFPAKSLTASGIKVEYRVLLKSE